MCQPRCAARLFANQSLIKYLGFPVPALPGTISGYGFTRLQFLLKIYSERTQAYQELSDLL